MRKIQFQLPYKAPGVKVIGNAQFVDGVCTVSASEANKMERILVRFHGCKATEIVEVQEEPVSEGQPTQPTLAVESTKAGEAKAPSK